MNGGKIGLAAVCALAVLAGGCGSSGGGGQPDAGATHAPVRVTVSGLQGSGLVLRNTSGATTEDLPVAANGATQFPTELATGASYAVTVEAQPSSPAQTCAVQDGTGTMTATGAAVTVACTTPPVPTYTIGGNVAGLAGGAVKLRNNGGDEITVAQNGAFTFPTALASGAAYAVTVSAPPAGQACTVASGSGTVPAANVTSVAVTCSTAYTIGGTISGLGSSGLVLASGQGESLPVASGATAFTFTAGAATSSTYAVTVATQPSGLTCTVASGSGTVAAANVTNVQVACRAAVVQRWEPPTTWGAVWPTTGSMVQHAWFGSAATSITEQGTGITWGVQNGPLPAPRRFDGLPAVTRYGSGPFDGSGSPRWQATGGDASLDLSGDMLVCAVVKPGWDPTDQLDGEEKGIFAKGVGFSSPPAGACTAQDSGTKCGAGWVLMQMHSQFCFHYQSKDSTGTYANMAYTPTYFADRGQPNTGPLNPSFIVVCGGRVGNEIVVAANQYGTAVEFGPMALMGSGTIALDPQGLTGSTHRATIGGYDIGGPHQFGGRVYETAVWNEPATPANIQAKFAAVQGLALNGQDPTPVTYLRNREGPYLGPDAGQGAGGLAYHTTWRHGPRLDPAKGLLFGLQGWNRLSFCEGISGGVVSGAIPCESTSATDRVVVAPGEAFGDSVGGSPLWAAAGGASTSAAQAIVPPGDSEKASAALVTLPPGASLTAPVLAFDAAGPVHGQLWLEADAATSGILRVTISPAQTAGDHADIDLSTLAPGTWTRFWLKGLTTSGAAGTMTIQALPANQATVSVHAWGADVTQINGGGDLGAFDPGPDMYDPSTTIGLFGGMFRNGVPEPQEDRPVNAVDVLELPALTSSATTAANGFCLSADVQPADGLAWTAPFARKRGIMGWLGASQAAQLYVTGTSDPGGAGRLCVAVTGAPAGACAPVPTAWAAGSKHNVKGCLSAVGALHLYGDGAPLGAPVPGVSPVPDAATGRVFVGNLAPGSAATWATTGNPAPWNGYVSKALVCRDPGPGNDASSCQ